MHQSVIDLLKEVAYEFKILLSEAKERLAAQDIQAYDNKLRQRVGLIRDLPGRVAPLLDRSTESLELLTTLQDFASLARESLDSESGFSMSVLLTSLSSNKEDPNALEALIAELEGSATVTTDVEQLQGALQMTAEALEDALAGRPVANVPHCFAAAETLLNGTEYEFHRRPKA